MPANPNTNDALTKHLSNAISELDKTLNSLQTRRVALVQALGHDPAKAQKRPGLAGAAKGATKPATAKAASAGASGGNGGAKKGYINHVVNFLIGRPEAHADAILAHVQKQPGLGDTKRTAIDATLANELKKPEPLIERVRPGVFKATNRAFEQSQGARPQPVSRDAEQPVAEPVEASV